MQVFHGVAEVPSPSGPSAITIGNFDGVHLGHQQLFQAVKKKPYTHIAYTFRPHPQHALNPAKAPPLLLTYDEKLKRIEMDQVIEEPFSREFSTLTAQDFYEKILIAKLNAKALVIGYDFAFGK